MTRAEEDAILFEFERNEKGRTMFEPDGRSWKFTERAKQAQNAVSRHPLRLTYITPSSSNPRWSTLSEMGEAVQHIPSNQVSPSRVDCVLREPSSTEARLRLGVSTRVPSRDVCFKAQAPRPALRGVRTVTRRDIRYLRRAQPSQKPSSETRRSIAISRTPSGSPCESTLRNVRVSESRCRHAKPFTNKYRAMFAVWDNYDIEEAGCDVENVLSILRMQRWNVGTRTEALWWCV